MSNQESVGYAARAPFAASVAARGGSRGASEPAARSAHTPAPSVSNAGPDAIWGHYNNYRSNGLAVSAVVHAVLIGLILLGAAFHSQIAEKIQPHETVTLIAPSPDTYTLAPAKKEVGGGGGGGEHARLEAPKGRLPKMAITQITPPSIVVRNEKPKLAVEPTVVAPPQIQVAENHMPTLGDPKSVLPSAPPSNGIGSGGGIGSGSGSGVGVGHGPGVGQGTGGGIGGGVFKVGGGISAPKPVSTPEAQYTEEARDAKTQGTCILWLIVDTEGHPRDIRVVHGLGHGLEAKAVEAVKQWRFAPAMKDGKPVNVQISVEVGFKLY